MNGFTRALFSLFLVACSISGAYAQGRILLYASVDWEGRDLQPANLAAMHSLRIARPNLGLIHFLNAAYFTKPDADPNGVAAKMRSVLAPNDELGLHIHGWKTLFEASGVQYIGRPSYFDPGAGDGDDCRYDCGHDIPIHLYREEDLRKVVRFSLDKLQSEGFGRARGFRTGGWVGAPNVLTALAAEGIVWDSSAVPADWVQGTLGNVAGVNWVRQIWPAINILSQPFQIATPAGPIQEFPDNGALADYVDATQMVQTFDHLADTLRKNASHDLILHVGFHQESAARFLDRFRAGLDRIEARARQRGVTLVYPALPLVRTSH